MVKAIVPPPTRPPGGFVLPAATPALSWWDHALLCLMFLLVCGAVGGAVVLIGDSIPPACR